MPAALSPFIGERPKMPVLALLYLKVLLERIAAGLAVSYA